MFAKSINTVNDQKIKKRDIYSKKIYNINKEGELFVLKKNCPQVIWCKIYIPRKKKVNKFIIQKFVFKSTRKKNKKIISKQFKFKFNLNSDLF